MRDVLQNPPASVDETCKLLLELLNISPTDQAARSLRLATAFGSAATASRMLASMPTDDRRCNTKADLLRVKEEAEHAFLESAHLLSDKHAVLNG